MTEKEIIENELSLYDKKRDRSENTYIDDDQFILDLEQYKSLLSRDTIFTLPKPTFLPRIKQLFQTIKYNIKFIRF